MIFLDPILVLIITILIVLAILVKYLGKIYPLLFELTPLACFRLKFKSPSYLTPSTPSTSSRTQIAGIFAWCARHLGQRSCLHL